MRIIHTCLRYPPASGGAENYISGIVEHTRHLPGADVRVLTSKMRTHGPISELDPDRLTDDPPYIQRLHHAATPFISYPRLQALSYYLDHHRPDIIHAYGFWYQPADIAARYARLHNIPFIFHPIYYENRIRRKALWQLYRRTYGAATFAAADVVVVISPFEEKIIRQAKMPIRRVELIPPGIDVGQLARPQPNPFSDRKITGKVLLTVSRLSAGKGLDDVVSALPAVMKVQPSVQLAIAGEDFGAKHALMITANKLGVTSRIHFLGKLSAEELIGAYQHADVLVHPSHYEAFGIVLAEGLAAGTPIVARNVAAIPYVVPDGKAGLLFNSREEMIKNIATLLQNNALRQKLRHQGKLRAEQRFTWKSSIQKMAKLYHEFGQRSLKRA